MGTPWDRAAAGYVEQWMPRFVPYHLDLVRELTLKPGNRVLVTNAGPGAEVLAVARAVGDSGAVRATDRSPAMVRYCAEQVKRAGFGTAISCEAAESTNTAGGPWDAIVCSFGLWQYEDRTRLLSGWRDALDSRGKVGIITWGPTEDDDPYEQLNVALRVTMPHLGLPATRVHAERSAMEKMFAAGGLEMIRLTVVGHTLSFRSTEEFVRAISEGSTWRRVFESLEESQLQRVLARFYDAMGGPDIPLSFVMPATIAIACLPGANVEIEARPSLRAPSASVPPPSAAPVSARPPKN